MKKIGLVAAVALIFLVNGNFTFAQSLDYHAYEILNLLEYLYPEYLSPAPQMTRLDGDGAFYRLYSDTGIMIKTKDNHLYLVDDRDSRNLGMIDDYWFPFTQSEILFNWLEQQFPEFLAPTPQATQEGSSIFYRTYPETNAMIGTLDENLYFFDEQRQLCHLGPVEYWLGEILDSEEVLAKVYTIQQKSNGRYVDAFETSTIYHDYNLVTRGEQNNNTQKWILTPVGNNVYTIQQKSTMRYVDAFETSTISHDYNLVTREAQNNDTQKWILTPAGNNVYTIQQKSTMRYVDAFETKTISHDYELVTREAQADETQKWIFTLVPEDMQFLGIEYDLGEAAIVGQKPKVIATMEVENKTPTQQSMPLILSGTTEETSYFEHAAGVQVTVGTTISAGTPIIGATGSYQISAAYSFTYGETKNTSKSYEIPLNLLTDPLSTYRLSLLVWEGELSVPYVMFVQSNETGAIHVSRGTWSGVSTWDAKYKIEDITQR